MLQQDRLLPTNLRRQADPHVPFAMCPPVLRQQHLRMLLHMLA